MSYNYYGDIVWAVDLALAIIIIFTGLIIVFYAAAKDGSWKRRKDALLRIKKDVYEMVVADKDPSGNTCQLFTSSITPQQFIDIATNRTPAAVFFNDSERDFLKKCFVSAEQIRRLEKIVEFSFDKWRRIEAILCLGYMQREESVTIIIKSLFSRDSDVAYFSMISLGQIKTKESARALLRFLKKNAFVSYKVISILEGFPPEITDDVFKLAKDRDPVIRQKAAALLSKFDASEYFKELKNMTHDTYPEVRAAICDCLASCVKEKEEAALILKKCVRDGHWLVRRHAVLALEKVMKEKVVKEVVDLIYDASWSVLDAVKHVMVAHIKEALPYIEKFLKSDYDIARRYAVLILEESGYSDRVPKKE